MTTVADIIHVTKPNDCDGISILPTLTGIGSQEKHKYMFWTGGDRWAVRTGNWKAVSEPFKGNRPADWELYDLINDKGETTNIAKENPVQLRNMVNYAIEAYKEPVIGEIYDEVLYMKDHHANLPKPQLLE